ncbi:hypothetical protein J6590_017345 [Homalodisca vitripennis]|nr:hypothetical protein J6590_017345 [Homalodisca vitripennis]
MTTRQSHVTAAHAMSSALTPRVSPDVAALSPFLTFRSTTNYDWLKVKLTTGDVTTHFMRFSRPLVPHYIDRFHLFIRLQLTRNNYRYQMERYECSFHINQRFRVQFWCGRRGEAGCLYVMPSRVAWNGATAFTHYSTRSLPLSVVVSWSYHFVDILSRSTVTSRLMDG